MRSRPKSDLYRRFSASQKVLYKMINLQLITTTHAILYNSIKSKCMLLCPRSRKIRRHDNRVSSSVGNPGNQNSHILVSVTCLMNCPLLRACELAKCKQLQEYACPQKTQDKFVCGHILNVFSEAPLCRKTNRLRQEDAYKVQQCDAGRETKACGRIPGHYK